MRNYIEINNVSSLSLTGFAIKELPPISKPPMRNSIEEIDGRDGDIITKLGYGAYDKTIEVGLFGDDYDINEIISFFNSEGTITFSNEPDKYYNFTILGQIDFEKLVKFKTAAISFHCQPFKYKKGEEPIEVEYEYVTGEGTSTITLNDTSTNTMKIQLFGAAEQSGTPSVSTPVPISVARGTNTIVVENSDATISNSYSIDLPVENLVNADEHLYGTSNGIKTTYSEGYYNINGTATSSWAYIANNVPLNLRAGTYTFSISKALPFRIYIALKNGSTTVRTLTISAGNTYGTDSVSSNVTSYELTITNMTNGTEYDEIVGIQLEEGSTHNTYAPRGTAIELAKIGDHQDYIYKSNRKWYLHKEIGKYRLNHNTTNYFSFSQNTGYSRIMIAKSTLGMATSSWTNGVLLTTHFAQMTGGTPTAGTFQTNSNGNNIYFNIPDSIDSLANATTYMDELGCVAYSVLATPTNTEITNQNLLQQLNTLSRAKSKESQTIVSQTNNDGPFYLKATATKSGTASASVVNLGNIYAKPILNLVGNGNVSVSLNGNQLFSIDLLEPNSIVIDPNKLEAYNPSSLNLMNRKVVGDIANLKLPEGENEISFDGDLTTATITNYSRWL